MPRIEPIWLSAANLVAINATVCAATGEPHALINAGALESGLSRARFRADYDPDADLATLGVELAYGIAMAHAFLQGNKRTAFAALVLFLEFNGGELDPADDFAKPVIDLITGTLDRTAFADLIRARLT